MAQNSGFLFSVVHSTSFVRRISKFRESLDLAHPWRRLFHLNSTGCEILQIVCLMVIENFVTWDCPDNDNFLQKGPSCADTVVGQGNTTSWKMCGLDKSTCLTVFFDISPSDRSNPPGAANQYLYLQFLTKYDATYLCIPLVSFI